MPPSTACIAPADDVSGVRDDAGVAERIHHPTAGPLACDVETVSAPQEPDQHLVGCTVGR